MIQLDAPDEVIAELELEPREMAKSPEFEAEIANLEPREIPSLLELDIPIPAAFRDNQSHATPTSRPRRDARAPVRYDSSQSFADTAHEFDVSDSRDSRARASTPIPNAPRLATPRRDSNAHLDDDTKETAHSDSHNECGIARSRESRISRISELPASVVGVANSQLLRDVFSKRDAASVYSCTRSTARRERVNPR